MIIDLGKFRWERDAPDHWSVRVGRFAASAWPEVRGPWHWEVWDFELEQDEEVLAGTAETIGKAQAQASVALVNYAASLIDSNAGLR